MTSSSSLFHDLKFLVMSLTLTPECKQKMLTEECFTELRKALADKCIDRVFKLSDTELKATIDTALGMINTEFDAFYEEDYQLNEKLNDYLKTLASLTSPNQSLKEIAKEISVLGGSGGVCTFTSGVEELRKQFTYIIDEVVKKSIEVENFDISAVNGFIENAEKLNSVMCMVESFYTSYVGSLVDAKDIVIVPKAGDVVEPYPAFTVEDVDVSPISPQVIETFDIINDTVTGMETFILNDDYESPLTKQQRYVEGVLFAQGHITLRAGNEGSIVDSIKAGAMKVYDSLSAALKAVKDFFFGKDDEEANKKTEAQAEKNINEINVMDDKGVPINDKAESGIVNLAENTETEDSEFKTIVKSLKSASDAPRVIKELGSLLKKETSNNTTLQKMYNDCQKSLDKLKSSTSKVSSIDEENKEVVSAAKQEVQEDTKETQEQFKETKAAMTQHKKYLAALRKAINGITPAIFKPAKEES